MKIHATAPLLCALAFACHTPPEKRAPEVTLPESWAASPESQAVLLDRWWQAFGDAQLDAAIDETLTANRDLAASAARLDAALAIARIAGADRLPGVGLGGNATRSKQIFVGLGNAFSGVPGGGSGPLETTTTTYGVSLDVSWEADLWGKLRARAGAAEADVLAGAEDHEALRQSLVAQTAKAWFAWCEARAQAELAVRTTESFERNEALVRRRYESGAVPALDLRRSESQTATSRAGLSARNQAVERVTRQLELLLGRTPTGALVSAAALPDAGSPPPAGLPSELLQRRPDLRAAEARLFAADERLIEARASLYPSLSLTGSVGRTSDELDDLLDGDFSVWSLMAGLLQPVYQGGRLAAGVDLAEARVREAAANYAGAVLRALSEVDGLLAIEDDLSIREEQLLLATERAREARELAAERYRSGLTDLTVLLDAERTALAAESQWLAVRRERVDARIDLHLALGGGFATWSGEESEESAP